MARQITCGWEENDLLATGWASVGGTAPTIVTTGPTPHSGTYCLLTSAVSGASNVRRSLATAKTSGSLFPRIYWQSPTALPAANTPLFTIANSGAATAQQLILLTTGAMRLSNAVASTTADTVTGLAANTWYRIEVDLVIHATAGSVILRMYPGDVTGVPAFTASLLSQNTLSTNAQQFWVGRTSGTTQFAYDDFSVNDESGTSQTANPGPEKIALMGPNSDTPGVTWTKTGSAPASTNWDGVNDVPGTPDDATTYNETSTTSTDRFGLTALPGAIPSNASMILMEVSARVSAGAASQQLVLNGWDDGGNGFNSAGIPLGNGTWAATTNEQRAVMTLAGKTPAQVNQFNAGYSGSLGVSAKRVSAVWVNVSWIDVTPVPPPPLLVNAAPARAASW